METVLLYVVGILVMVVGLLLSIGLHELGHLIPAKRFGVKVGQYMIGFGPTLWSKKVGDTEYGIKGIPLGGYISMAGMYPPERPGGRPRDASTSFMDPAPRSVSTGYPEVDFSGRSRRGFDVLVQDARAADQENVAGDDDRVFYKLAWWKRIIIMLGGPTMNLLIAVVLYLVILCGIGLPGATLTIDSVSQCVQSQASASSDCAPSDPQAPAAAAGIQPGDRLVSIGGTAIATPEQATAAIRAHPGEALPVVVERDGRQVDLTVTPAVNTVLAEDADGNPVTNADGTSQYVQAGFIGVVFANGLQQQPVTAVLPTVGQGIAHTAQIVVNLPQRLVQVAQAAFGGEKRDPNGPIGIVGVGRIAGEAASTESAPWINRIAFLLNLLASLNIALFVFNLVPLLPLDGGHVAGAIWEAIKRGVAKLFRRPDPGPVDIAKLLPLTMAVTAILGVMSLLLIYADIVNPVSLG